MAKRMRNDDTVVPTWDRDGQPISWEKFKQLRADDNYCVLARTQVWNDAEPGVRIMVSTRWEGRDQAAGVAPDADGPPTQRLLFETIVMFGNLHGVPDLNRTMCACMPTEADAAEFHDTMVRQAKVTLSVAQTVEEVATLFQEMMGVRRRFAGSDPTIDATRKALAAVARETIQSTLNKLRHGQAKPVRKVKNADGLCIVSYRDSVTGEVEHIWNSRDGAVPARITSRTGGDAVRFDHSFAPDHVPQVGDRVIEDIPESIARQHAVHHIEAIEAAERAGKRDHCARLNDTYSSREEAIEAIMNDQFPPGSWHLTVATAAWLAKIAACRELIDLNQPAFHVTVGGAPDVPETKVLTFDLTADAGATEKLMALLKTLGVDIDDDDIPKAPKAKA